MPRLASSLPKYRHHKASGQAVVTLSGLDVYLGLHGTRVSKAEYDRVVGEWLACGRQSPDAQGPDDLTVVEVLARYWRFAKQHYQKDGQPTGELENMRCAARVLKTVYGHTLVREFGPLALKALQLRMIDDNLSRGVINGRIGRIKRIFRWAVSEELCPANVLHGLQSVMGLQRGRTEARETEPVLPVDDLIIEATLKFLPPVVADMVRFQRLVGCRPGELCQLRPCGRRCRRVQKANRGHYDRIDGNGPGRDPCRLQISGRRLLGETRLSSNTVADYGPDNPTADNPNRAPLLSRDWVGAY